MSIAKIMGVGSATNERVKNDVYHTPTACTEALAKVEAEYWPQTIWEPCAGRGDLSSVLQAKKFKMIKTDLAQGADFLETSEARASAIVTNPPYRYASEFILHAHKLGVTYHAWLLKADFLNAQRAWQLIDEIGYPVRIWMLTERPDFLGQGAPTMNCSWYVWSGRHGSAKSRLLSIQRG
jgi:hypothetical protein